MGDAHFNAPAFACGIKGIKAGLYNGLNKNCSVREYSWDQGK
jgi:hypothetical protein